MPGFVSDSTLEQIRSASDIVDVISASLPLKRLGANFVALCPFHREKTPSFNVSPSKQFFHCYGCHKGGDVFKFVQEYENITFVEAVRRLAGRAGIQLEFERSPGYQKAQDLKQRLLEIHEQITQRWQGALNTEAAGQIARDYLAKRGVSWDAVKLFRLGYSPDAWDDTVNWAKSRGYEPVLMEQAGLIVKREGGDGYYDRFRGRLMFPICDEQGRVIAFSGRLLSGDEKTAKYVNSPETPVFTKGKVIYGLDKTKRAVLDANFAIICEGQLDLIACFMAGVKNVVAPQGTALTNDHARILKRYVNEVVLCFDSDNAGQNAMVRVVDELLGSGMGIRVATVPAPHDPDSLIREQGGSAFQRLIARAPNFFDFYLERLCAKNDLSTDGGRLAVLKDMGEAVRKLGNVVLADKYAQETALRLGVAPEAVRTEFRKSRPSASRVLTPRADQVEPVPTLVSSPSLKIESWLVRILLLDDDLVEWACKHLDLDWIQNGEVRQIVARRFEAHAQANWQGVPALLTELRESQACTFVTQALLDPRPIENRAQQLADITRRLRNHHLDQRIGELTRRSADPNLPEPESHSLIRQRLEIMELKRKPLEPVKATA